MKDFIYNFLFLRYRSFFSQIFTNFFSQIFALIFTIFTFSSVLFFLSCASKGIKGLKVPELEIKELKFDENGNFIFSASGVKEISICSDFEEKNRESKCETKSKCKSIKVNSLFSSSSFEISKPKNYSQIRVLLVGFGGKKKEFILNFAERKVVDKKKK
jgi:hypothetical protein